MQRHDEDEYLFDSYTIVVRADGAVDDELALWAAGRYSKEGPLPLPTQRLAQELDNLQLDRAYELAKERLERQVQLWDWEEDVELLGVAKVVALSTQ